MKCISKFNFNVLAGVLRKHQDPSPTRRTNAVTCTQRLLSVYWQLCERAASKHFVLVMNPGNTVQRESTTLVSELTFRDSRFDSTPLQYETREPRPQNFIQAESSLPQRLYYKLYKQTSKIFFPFVSFVHGSFLENLLLVKIKRD